MSKLHSFLFGALLLGTVVACNKENLGPTDQEIFQSNQVDIQNYVASKGLSGTLTSSGVYVSIQKPSSSTVSPAIGLEAEYNYKLYTLTRGTSTTTVTDLLVDSSYATKSTYSYIVPNQVGLVEGLLRMHEGDQALILLPSAYAFGRTGTGVIAPNTPIRLDMTLKRVRTEDEQINEYLTANKLTPTEVTMSGLRFIKTTDNPSGITPTATQTLIIKYKGKLLRSASAFDSTGTGTYASTLGRFITGFNEGLSKLKVGEKATLVFPSAIGYGSTGNQSIPPYAPLRFDVELVSAQ